MALVALWLTDFRCIASAELRPDPTGVTVLRGPNGAGKTSVLEAVGWLATQRSFRGAARETMVRGGAAQAVVRAEADASGRAVLLEGELPLERPTRLLANRQVVRRRSDLRGALRVSVFAPSDLSLVQDGPAGRRAFLDETLATLQARSEVLVTEVERVVRQRTALLRQAGGRAGAEIEATLDVWDTRLADAGARLADERDALVMALAPPAAAAYAHLSGTGDAVTLAYRRSWEGPLDEALARARREDLRRQMTGVGPHRDELEVHVDGRSARTHASQGEQRCAALALRLAAHELARAGAEAPPVLLLDDVFSELDARRCDALVERLPAGQVLLTTAVDPPPAVAGTVIEVASGRLATPAGRS